MTAKIAAECLVELIQGEAEGRNDCELRIIANRIWEVITPWLPKAKRPEGLPEPMTHKEVLQFETRVMEFGKYAGTPVADVPFAYLEWLCDKNRQDWKELFRYLSNPRVKQEREAGVEGAKYDD